MKYFKAKRYYITIKSNKYVEKKVHQRQQYEDDDTDIMKSRKMTRKMLKHDAKNLLAET